MKKRREIERTRDCVHERKRESVRDSELKAKVIGFIRKPEKVPISSLKLVTSI